MSESAVQQTGSVDHVVQPGRWEFNDEVAEVFDDMLRRSIPQYETMRSLTYEMGRHFVQRKTAVVDVGCSRGESLARFIQRFGALNHFVGLEVSEPMLEAARQRFSGYINAGIVEIRKHDLRVDDYPSVMASLTLAVLTLQFVPMEHRIRVLDSIYESTVPGGAMILVEKVVGGSSAVDRIMVDEYHEMKRHNGYSETEIQAKRISLEGVLVPQTAAMNELLLKGAGFRQVECFWRWMNFAAWVAVK